MNGLHRGLRTDGPIPTARLPFRCFVPLLLGVLGGYLFFGRAFAYLHVPGTPVFVGEITLAVGALEAIRLLPVLRDTVRRSRTLCWLLALMGLGVVLLVRDLSEYGFFAIRDSAIWYYGAFAFLVAAVVRVRPDFPELALSWYRRVIPAFLVWAPIAVLLSRVDVNIPNVPFSDVSLFTFKPGDIAVNVAVATAFLWLDPDSDRSDTGAAARWYVLIALGLVGLLVAGSQNRGGLVAGAAVLCAAYFVTRQRRRVLAAAVTAAALLLVLGGLFEVRLQLGSRELSLEQLSRNIDSILDPDGVRGDDYLAGTVQWRLELWDQVLNDTVRGDHGLLGRGFGPNLTVIYGYRDADEADQGLRNAHNSHLTVLGRMGVFGIGLWLGLWGSLLLQLRRRNGSLAPEAHGLRFVRGWTTIAVVGMLVNAVFDPSLEGPQAGIWLWTLVGVATAPVFASPLPVGGRGQSEAFAMVHPGGRAG